MSWFTTITQEEEGSELLYRPPWQDLQNLYKTEKIVFIWFDFDQSFSRTIFCFCSKDYQEFLPDWYETICRFASKNYDRMLHCNSLKIVNFSKESYKNLHQWSPKFVALIPLKNRTCDSANLWYKQKLRTQVKSQKAKFFK